MAETLCSNCHREATWESTSTTASKVYFCDVHKPRNAERSRAYRKISRRKKKTEPRVTNYADVVTPPLEEEPQEEPSEASGTLDGEK